MVVRCVEGYSIFFSEAAQDLDPSEIDASTNLNGSADELVRNHSIDKVASFGVESFAGNAEYVEALRSRDRYHDVGVGQEIAFGVVDSDDALAYVACAIGDDGSGGAADVTVPGLGRLRIPCDFDGLANGEFADLGLVEVGTNLNAVEIGEIKQVFASRDKIIGGDRDRVDSTANGARLLSSL